MFSLNNGEEYHLLQAFTISAIDYMNEDFVILGSYVFECTIPNEVNGQPITGFYYTDNGFGLQLDTFTTDHDKQLSIHSGQRSRGAPASLVVQSHPNSCLNL